FFTEAHTPWGSAIDYRVPQVRAFAIENALQWLGDYRFDGLRLDAVNTIVEVGEVPILHDLSAAVGRLAAETGRHIHLVLENGDQIGNRALGDRLESFADPRGIEAALALTLLAPMTLMLFMGEEWGSKTPFPFFCDFHGGLANAVRNGRRREYGWAYAKYGDEVPDPLAAATFESAVLDWQTCKTAAGEMRLALVRQLLAIR